MTLKLAAMAALAGLAAATAARAGDIALPQGPEIAYFQTGTIFHSGLRDTHTIALTFDDGPNANTPGVLDTLKAYNVKATFFIVGKMAHAHPDVLARIAAEGHLLANHSADHAMLSRKYDAEPEKLIREVREVHDLIAPLMKPTDALFFRAPYGSWHSAHAEILNADPVLRNYTGPIYWDIGGDLIMRDSYVMSAADWSCWHHHWTPDICAKGYLREIRRKNGGVVLMHCIHHQSPELVADVVPALVEEGYSFVRIDQIAKYKPFETPQAPAAIADIGAPVRSAQLIPPADVK